MNDLYYNRRIVLSTLHICPRAVWLKNFESISSAVIYYKKQHIKKLSYENLKELLYLTQRPIQDYKRWTMFRLSSIYQAIISITILTILYYKEVFVSYYKINVLCPHICTQLQLVSINHHYWYFLVHLHCSSLIFSCIVPSQYTIIDLISKIMDLLILTLLVLTKQTSLYSYVL